MQDFLAEFTLGESVYQSLVEAGCVSLGILRQLDAEMLRTVPGLLLVPILILTKQSTIQRLDEILAQLAVS